MSRNSLLVDRLFFN